MKTIILSIFCILYSFAVQAKCVIELAPVMISYATGKNLEKIESSNDIKIKWTKYFIDQESAIWRNSNNIPNGSTASCKYSGSGRDGCKINAPEHVRNMKADLILDAFIREEAIRDKNGCYVWRYTQSILTKDANTKMVLNSEDVGTRYYVSCGILEGGAQFAGWPSQAAFRWFSKNKLIHSIQNAKANFCQ